METAAIPTETRTLTEKTFVQRLGYGLLMGGMAGMAVGALGLNSLAPGFNHTLLLAMALGGVVGISRWRPLLWKLNAFLIVVILLLAYTPIAGALVRSLRRSDSPAKADAIVVLAGGYVDDQTISARAQDRVLRGIDLLRAGYSDQMFLTRPQGPAGNWTNLVRQEMKNLGLHYAVEEVGPVVNTHDEALAVSRIFRERNWSRVILVTQAWHMRRAAAVFEAAGVHVICQPCGDSTCDAEHPSTPQDRVGAFGDWLHEEVGYWIYRERGWL